MSARSSPSLGRGWLVLACAAAAASSCGTRAALLDSTIRGCPSAPFRASGARCTFDATCVYEGPRAGAPGIDASLSCDCIDGAIECRETSTPCPSCVLPECPLVTVPGAGCTYEGDDHERPRNAECFLPADPPRTPRDSTCACDFPGPRWRCIELE